MYSDVFCKVYNEFGWNYYPEAFGQELLQWIRQTGAHVRTAMDLGCGTGILCELLCKQGIHASGTDLSENMIQVARENFPHLSFEVANMITYRPEKQFDLVTCTGDALNHIMDMADVETIFRNVYGYLAEGGYFIFDLLNENEVSDSEPFDMDFTDTTRIWFQMTRPAQSKVTLTIRVYEEGNLAFEENIRETIHDPQIICRLLEQAGFTLVKCADRLLDSSNPGTTWFIIARK